MDIEILREIPEDPTKVMQLARNDYSAEQSKTYTVYQQPECEAQNDIMFLKGVKWYRTFSIRRYLEELLSLKDK